jgi:hypothetical protein
MTDDLGYLGLVGLTPTTRAKIKGPGGLPRLFNLSASPNEECLRKCLCSIELRFNLEKINLFNLTRL